jgi:transcriptional regulator with XRE-family HTH domain
MGMESNVLADQIDIDVGARIMLRRRVLGISQVELAKQVGVTFQQIQKYEKGMNRISSSRMQMIAAALQISPSSFFQEDGVQESGGTPLAGMSKDTVELARAFGKIENPKTRKTIIALVEGLSDAE